MRSLITLTLLLALTACVMPGKVEDTWTDDGAAARRQNNKPQVVVCILEAVDIGTQVVGVLQECGYVVERIVPASDVGLPVVSELATSEIELAELLRHRGDWSLWLAAELGAESKRFAGADLVVTVRLACGRVRLPPDRKNTYNLGPRLARLDIAAVDVKTKRSTFAYTATYQAREARTSTAYTPDYGKDTATRAEGMPPLVEAFRKQLSTYVSK